MIDIGLCCMYLMKRMEFVGRVAGPDFIAGRTTWWKGGRAAWWKGREGGGVKGIRSLMDHFFGMVIVSSYISVLVPTTSEYARLVASIEVTGSSFKILSLVTKVNANSSAWGLI